MPDARRNRFRAVLHTRAEELLAGGDAEGALAARLVAALFPVTVGVLSAPQAPPPLAIPALASALAYLAAAYVGQACDPGNAGKAMHAFIEAFAEEAREFAAYVDGKGDGQ